MKKIEAFKTSDDMIFETEAEANRHEKKITFEKDLENFVDSFFFRGIDDTDIVDAIREGKDRLRKILNSAPR